MAFWLSIALSMTCILKTQKTHQWNRWDILFLLSSWQMFNFKIWQNYIGAYLDYSYEISATLCFLLAVGYAYRRGLEIDYSFTWPELKKLFWWLAALAGILIPLGLKMNFLKFNPRLDPQFIIWTAVSYLLFVATVEEIIFRGIILNLFRRQMKDWCALLITTVLFATIFSHICGHGLFPNFRYVGLAFIAGLVYGLVYVKTKSLVAPIVVHGSVDAIWRIFLS